MNPICSAYLNMQAACDETGHCDTGDTIRPTGPARALQWQGGIEERTCDRLRYASVSPSPVRTKREETPMSRIVVIKGSAREGGNSNSMADAFIEAAKGLGHEIVECNATKMNLNGCHGCMTCFKSGKACTHDDDFNTIADDLLEADGWVFSFPIYWYTMPGQTKCILDNVFSFAVGGKSCKGKKIALISCCEENDMTVFDHAVGPFERGGALMGWEFVGNVLVPGVNNVGDIANTDGCARAAELAKKF